MLRFRVWVIFCCLVIVGVSGSGALGLMTTQLGGGIGKCYEFV